MFIQGFNNMINSINQNSIVICDKVKTLSRNNLNIYAYKRAIENKGASLVILEVCNFAVNSSPQATLCFQMISSLENYNREIQEKI